MEMFALLTACVCIGLSSGNLMQYGGSHQFRVPSRAEYLYYVREFSSLEMVLWTRSKPLETVRGALYGRDFEIDKVTQEDNGDYVFKTKDQRFLSRSTITVIHNEETYKHMVGDELHLEFFLDPKLCTLSFLTLHGDNLEIVESGSVRHRYFGQRMEFRHFVPMGFNVDITDLRVEDSGVFELRDLKHNLAMRVNVVVEEHASVWTNVGLAAGIMAAVVLSGCCLKTCCCKKSSKSRDPDPEPAESPANLQQHSTEPNPPRYSVEPRPPVNRGYAYAYQPAVPAPSVETYSPASVPFTAPPAQAPATGGQAAAPEVSSSFLSSDDDPHFEMKGVSMAPPLYSEKTSADTYTSDKLNFSFL